MGFRHSNRKECQHQISWQTILLKTAGSTGKDPQAKKLTLSFLRTVHTRQDEYTVSVFAIYISNRNRNLSLSLITAFLQPNLKHEQLLTPVPGVTALPTISPLWFLCGTIKSHLYVRSRLQLDQKDYPPLQARPLHLLALFAKTSKSGPPVSGDATKSRDKAMKSTT